MCISLYNRPFHGNCGPVIGACAQTLPDGNILITHIALFTSAHISRYTDKLNGLR